MEIAYLYIMFVIMIWACSISKYRQYQRGDDLNLNEYNCKKIYMGKVTNQHGCHTINMNNDGNWKYFLYGHVVYQNEENSNWK